MLLGYAIYLFANPDPYNISIILSGWAPLILCGALTVIATLGLRGAYKAQHMNKEGFDCNCALWMYVFIVTLVLICLIVVAALAIWLTGALRDGISGEINAAVESVDAQITKMISDMIEATPENWASIETKYQCCGYNNVGDYGDCPVDSDLPCRDKIMQFIQDNVAIASGISGTVIFMLTVVLFASCSLCCWKPVKHAMELHDQDPEQPQAAA